jgi:hypothetical protein
MGAVRDALAGGRLLRTGDAATLDTTERVLGEGTIDRASAVRVGGGMNGDRFRMRIHPPAAMPGAASMWAVEKPAEAQAAQEEFAYLLARELGIDHLVPAVARRADGSAWIDFKPGHALSMAGVTDVGSLDRALTRSYLTDELLELTPVEAAQAARIDRQLLQAFDYLIANNDRHMGNGLVDARAGGRLHFIDQGHAGRGSVQTGASALEPELRSFQAGSRGGRVDLDPAVVGQLRARLTHQRIRELHAQVFDNPDVATPSASSSVGLRFYTTAAGSSFREGIVQRLDRVMADGGYTHRGYSGDAAGELPPMIDGAHNPVGLHAVRRQFDAFPGAGRF